MRAAEALEAGGVDLRVLSMHTLKPLDDEAILRAADETRALVTLEEHSIVGGLGSAVAELLAESAEVQNRASSGSAYRRGSPPVSDHRSSYSPRTGSTSTASTTP